MSQLIGAQTLPPPIMLLRVQRIVSADGRQNPLPCKFLRVMEYFLIARRPVFGQYLPQQRHGRSVGAVCGLKKLPFSPPSNGD